MPDLNEPTLATGLRWLVDTEQPDDAIIQHHGVMLDADGNRRFQFIPSGANGHAVVAVDVVAVEWVDVDPWTKAPANPLEPGELEALAAQIAALGFEVSDTWNGHPDVTGSVGLKRAAHPSLLAAVDRYHAGCPEHPTRGVFCDCAWYAHGNARIVRPDVAVGGAA